MKTQQIIYHSPPPLLKCRLTHARLLSVLAAQAIAGLVAPIGEGVANEKTHKREGPEAHVDAHAEQRVDEGRHPHDVKAVQERDPGHRRKGQPLA